MSARLCPPDCQLAQKWLSRRDRYVCVWNTWRRQKMDLIFVFTSCHLCPYCRIRNWDPRLHQSTCERERGESTEEAKRVVRTCVKSAIWAMSSRSERETRSIDFKAHAKGMKRRPMHRILAALFSSRRLGSTDNGVLVVGIATLEGKREFSSLLLSLSKDSSHSSSGLIRLLENKRESLFSFLIDVFFFYFSSPLFLRVEGEIVDLLKLFMFATAIIIQP